MDVIAERSDIDAAVSGKTICTIFADAEKKWGDRPALRWKRNGDWHVLTWTAYREQVAAVTLALRELGFGAGQFGLIMARNIPEHVIADLGIVHAGGAAISVYNTLAPEQIEYVANHSEATVAFVQDEGFLAKFLEIRSRVPSLRHIVLVHGEPPEGIMSWDSLVEAGRAAYARDPSAFEKSWRAVGPEDTVSLIYTSGTTGPPKGVMYSHNNIVWTLESARRILELHNETLLSYLPLAHVSERFTSQWGSIYNGHEVYLCPDPSELLPYLLEARPTAFVGVPRVWEKLMAGINAGLGAEPDETKRQMAQGALAASMQAYRLRRDGQPVPAELAAVVERAQPLFALLRAKVGLDRVHLAVTSTAPCRPEVHEFWAALGMPLYEVWGMSELTGPATAVPFGDHKAPSIGVALPGVEVRLGDDGELLVRGGNVMVGYYHDPTQTAEAIDDDGADHHIGGQEHLARQPRIAREVEPDHRPGGRDRRRPEVHLGAGRAGSASGAAVGERSRHRFVHLAGGAVGSSGDGRRGAARADDRQHASLSSRAVQTIHDPADRVVARVRRADADHEAQAAGDRVEIPPADRRDVCAAVGRPRGRPGLCRPQWARGVSSARR
jgi:long-chain acyl-CoA synthetase